MRGIFQRTEAATSGYISEAAACPGWKFHRKGRRKRGERTRGWVVYTCPSLLTSFATRTGGPANSVTNRWTSRLARDETRFTMLPPWNSIVPHAPSTTFSLLQREQKYTFWFSKGRKCGGETIWRLEEIWIWNWVISRTLEFSRRGGVEEKRRRVKGCLKRTPRGRPSFENGSIAGVSTGDRPSLVYYRDNRLFARSFTAA